jgi:hypothetical protein
VGEDARETRRRRAEGRGRDNHGAAAYRGLTCAARASGAYGVNTGSCSAYERALRQVAIGRKNWLFAGSAKHAEALAHLLTLDASAKLHGLPAETCFRDLIRVLPFWPEDRYLELCPREWAKTRARLDDAELRAEVGTITVPPPPTAG